MREKETENEINQPVFRFVLIITVQKGDLCKMEALSRWKAERENEK
jgi:hypothetical protein